jgi:hypothetical protein
VSDTSTRITVPASEVRVGDRIFARGLELLVTRIDEAFFGTEGMRAFVEDTETQWLKLPAPSDAELEIERRDR